MPLLVPGAGAVLLALFTVGCPQPGDLENADAYPADPRVGKAGGSSTGGSGGGASTPACEDVDCAKAVLKSCNAACHAAPPADLGKLDLLTAGVSARLKDQPSKHDAVPMGAECPSGDKLIDSANQAESWFLKKLTNSFGNCGSAMPVGPALSASDLECMKTFVACVAMSGGSSTTGGQSSGGAAAGGAATGGAATGGAATGGAATGGGGAATAGGGSGGTGGA